MELKGLLDDERLIRLKQSFPGLPERRALYTTPALMELLYGPWNEIQWERRWNRVRQQFDDFIDGVRLTLRSAPRVKSSCFMSRLEPEASEIWEIRCRDPRPGIRLLGSFIERDVFVVLSCAPHECLRNDDDWKGAIEHYKGEWCKYFSGPAFSGVYPNGYLTNAIILD
jgi:hypothetical protein